MNWTLLTPGQGRIVAAVADGGRGFGYGSTPTRICRRAAQKVRNQDCRGRLVQRDGFLAGPDSGAFALLHILHDLVPHRFEHADIAPAVPLGHDISADVDEKAVPQGPFRVPRTEHARDFLGRESQSPHEHKPHLGERRHHALLDPVVNYLEVVTARPRPYDVGRMAAPSHL